MPSFSRALLVGYAVAVFAALLSPILIVVLYAFSADAGLTFPPSGLSLRWFRYIAERRELLTATWISVQVAAVASAASVTLGMLASLALVRGRFPGRAVIDAALMSPLSLPGIITGVAMLQFMSLIGFTDSFWRLAVAHVVVCTPYAIRSISANLYGIDPLLEEASTVMGAGPWRTFRRVVLPLLRPGVAAGFMFCFVTSFDNVIVSIYLISADTVTLPIRILTYLEWQFDPSVAAICTVLVAVTTVCILAAEALAGLSSRVSPRT